MDPGDTVLRKSSRSQNTTCSASISTQVPTGKPTETEARSGPPTPRVGGGDMEGAVRKRKASSWGAETRQQQGDHCRTLRLY